MSERQRYEVFETAHGFIAIAWSASGITSLRLPVGSPAAAEHARAHFGIEHEARALAKLYAELLP